MKHPIGLSRQQFALIVVEVAHGFFEVPAHEVTAFQTLTKCLATAGMVVAFHHDYPRGIIANATDELEDGSGIANGFPDFFIGTHTLSKLRVVTSMGHHSQK
jgi:hypothetical protein